MRRESADFIGARSRAGAAKRPDVELQPIPIVETSNTWRKRGRSCRHKRNDHRFIRTAYHLRRVPRMNAGAKVIDQQGLCKAPHFPKAASGYERMSTATAASRRWPALSDELQSGRRWRPIVSTGGSS